MIHLLEEAKDSLHDNSLRQAARSISKAIAALEERNKMIRLADRSQAGWAAVREYEDDDLADDSADERKLRGADSRAMAAMKRTGNPTNFNNNGNNNNNASSGSQQANNGQQSSSAGPNQG